MKITKKFTTGVACGLIGLIIGGIFGSETVVEEKNVEVPVVQEENKIEKPSDNIKLPSEEIMEIIENEDNRCGIGDTITISTGNGDYEITFTDAYFTEYRNEFEEPQPENVLVVEYEYTNISYEPLIADGLYVMYGLDYQIYGQDGFSLDTYPYYPLDGDSVSVGRSSVGSNSFHVNNGQTHFEIEIADVIVEIDL